LCEILEVTSLPDYLGDLPALIMLRIVDCNIKTIPPAIQRLADNGELIFLRTAEDDCNRYHGISECQRKPLGE
jgi:hypothetical protein